MNIYTAGTAFKAHATANAREYADWDAAFTAWLCNAPRSQPAAPVAPVVDLTARKNLQAALSRWNTAAPPYPPTVAGDVTRERRFRADFDHMAAECGDYDKAVAYAVANIGKERA
ncbi:hypothetical protein ACRQFN_09295 [Actinotignum sp. GS-2025e]|uniref:hypothetical protein n=1 Tax=unclassified Actinotignum TaxID=2632702 RepID=UPI003F488167